MERRYVSLSKKMSLALRHNPAKFGLELDDEGWIDLCAFLKAMKMTRDELEFIQANNNKKRFVVEKERIKAYYGHSLEVDLSPSEPPAILYHGTPPKAADIILVEGIKPMARQKAHHSTDTATARIVGKRRHPNPTVLVVEAQKAHDEGVKFYFGNEDIWMSDEVPAKYLKRLR